MTRTDERSGMPGFRRRLAPLLLLIACLASAAAFAIEPKEVGLVLMHGKWGAPPGPLAMYFEREGYLVSQPLMPWSKRRNYDVTYDQALEEIHAEVGKLRQRGAKKVIVGGHSFGANAALAYASRFQDIDGVMLFAPGHMPAAWYRNGTTKSDVDKARELMSQGKGDTTVSFTDINQGRTSNMSATAAVYLSWFDPEGLANFAKSAAAIAKPVPIFCAMSSAEARLGRDFFFSRAPSHPKSVYLEAAAGHGSAAEAVSKEASEFVKSVAGD